MPLFSPSEVSKSHVNFLFFFLQGFFFCGAWGVGRKGYAACGILVPQPGIEPMPPALGQWSLKHWTTREIPQLDFLNFVLGYSQLTSNIMRVLDKQQRDSGIHIHVSIPAKLPSIQDIT